MSKALEESPLGGTTPRSSVSPLESKKRENVPHYLRASTGSCHDLCKYGHKHSSEEELRSSGGRHKKLPSYLNNLALHRSAILDRSKDVRNRSLSLAKSSISMGEAERVVSKSTEAIRIGAASNEHLVPLTTTSAEHKILSSGGSKKKSMVSEKAPTSLRYSNGVSKCGRKEASPGKTVTYSAKLKVPEKILPEKSRTVDKVTTVKRSSLERTASASTVLNNKKAPATSQASSHHLLSSKYKTTPKGKVTPPSSAITRVRAKSGQSPMRSSNANTHGKEGSDMSRPSFCMESKLTASVEIQESLHVSGYSVGSLPAQPSSDATDCLGISRPAPEESSKSISDEDMLGNTEKGKSLACEASMEGNKAIELQQSLDDTEFNAETHESPEHELAEENVMDGRVSKDDDSQTDDACICQLPEQLTVVENADVYDLVLTQSNAKTEDDHIKCSSFVDSLNTNDKKEVGVHEDLQRSVEILVLDEKRVEEPEYCHDIASANAAENDKVDVLDSRTVNCASYCNSDSENSSDGELLEEPKSMLIQPSDSTIQIAVLPSVTNGNIESEELKSRIIIPQLPEELSDDEFYEEYDFEFSESDQSGTEDEDASVNRNRDESVKATDQRLRRVAALQLDDTNATSYKLRFKRGKIVELPQDSNGPRRLKFRRKVANEVLNSQSQSPRRIYKRSNTNEVVPANSDVESSGVKLRHQQAQEKKDAQGLFNNVIEETASKLVESRKSKVKALVGAFETVISLQDGKPTSQAGNSQDSVQEGEGNAPEDCE